MSKDYVKFECIHIVNTELNNPNESQALAYADIDGYTANENDEGIVICRVWILIQPIDIMNNKGFIVDWHHNGYRFNEKVLKLVDYAKEELKKHANGIADRIMQKAYSRYKLKWMLEHNHTLGELIIILNAQMEKKNGAKNVIEAFKQMQENDEFFNGESWLCEAEFRSLKANDETLMQDLLSGNEYEIWKNR